MKRIITILFILFSALNLQAQVDKDFPYPTIPNNLTVPSERASYLVEHFWDNFNLQDTTKTSNRKLIEQYFVDYLSLFQIAKKESIEKSVQNMINLLASNTDDFLFFMDIAEKYLYQTTSPMANITHYRLFLNKTIHCNKLDNIYKSRYEFLLSRLEKNKIGDIAPDITFYSKTGEKNLYSISGYNIILLFYDYNCETCINLITEIKEDSIINSLLNNGAIKIVAICTNITMPQWIKYRQIIPATWINGYDSSDIIKLQDKYITDELPAMFLLDSSKTIIQKGNNLNTIKKFIKNQQ